MNKKGEIGSTLTWIVATTIIFIIVLIFMLITGVFGGGYKEEKVFSLKFSEQQQSLYAIYKTPEIEEGIKDGDYDEVEKEVKVILERIGEERYGHPSLWKLDIFKNGKKKKIMIGRMKTRNALQEFYFSDKEIKLRIYRG